MDEAAKAAIEAELAPGEKLLWVGQPKQGFYFNSEDENSLVIGISLIFISFISLGISLSLWKNTEASNTLEQTGIILLFVISIIFNVLGFYFAFGTYKEDISERKHTLYGLTNKRALIVFGPFRRNLRAANLLPSTEINFQENRDRIGTITFGKPPDLNYIQRHFPWPGAPKPAPSFESIPDARRVYELVRDIQMGVIPPEK